MGIEKPILFNSDMVRAILDDRKTATRRAIPERILDKYYDYDEHCNCVIIQDIPCTRIYEIEFFMNHARYQPGDILYVRETWAFATCINCNGNYRRKGAPVNCYDYQAVEYDDGDSISDGCFIYRADFENQERIIWRPSIHMPKQVARIWLKVTDVRVERLQEITECQIIAEGTPYDQEEYDQLKRGEMVVHRAETYLRGCFMDLWNATIKKADADRYGWSANPWVWVTEFERCEKPEEGRA